MSTDHKASTAGVTRRLASLLAAITALCAVPGPANAFCGFYVSGSNEGLFNKATRVALMRQGTRTVLSMSNDYQGPPQDFAMVVPVPVVLQRENVRTLPHDVFNHLEQLTAPRLVEYWEEDPCAPEPSMMEMSRAGAAPPTSAAPAEREADRHGVRVEARFTVGEYDVVVLSATESNGLEAYLRENQYNIPQGASRYLAPYVREQWKFFVAKVDIERAQRRPDGSARLSPLRFHYDSPEFRLPVRLGLMNAPDAQDLIVYVLHPSSRFEVANYRNVFIPTNLDVRDGVRRQFPAFYAQLFDATIASAGGRAVVTEYAWDSSSCDPCPTPPLEPQELATLGADALQSAADQGQQLDAPMQPGIGSMVVTRLHTRYNRDTLNEDLVFREAQPVVGGREFVTDANSGPERGARPDSSNNFQARYAIRHRWTGPIACNNPRRGVWGGPPDGQQPAPQPAQDLASAPRGRVDLPAVVLTPTPGVDLNAKLTFGQGSTRLRGPAVPAPAAPRGCACATVIGRHGRLGALALLGAGSIAAGRLARRSRRSRRRH